MYRRNTKGWFKHLDFMLLDLICLQVSFLLSYCVRLGFENPYTVPAYRNMGLLIMVFDLLVMLLYGTFTDVLKRTMYQELSKTCKHVLWLVAACMIYLYAAHIGASYSRIVMFLMFLLYACLTFLSRQVWKNYLQTRTGLSSARTVLVITSQDRAESTVRNLQLKEYGNIHVTGLVLLDADRVGEEIMGVPVVATKDTAAEYICREWIDEVFIRYPHQEQIEWDRVRKLSNAGVIVHLKLEDGFETLGNERIIETIGGYPVITTTLNSMTHRQAFMKRCLDIFGGIVGCAITGVLYLYVAPRIKKASPGPVFFKQTRIGRNGKQFQLYKFRSMYPDAEERKAKLYDQNRVGDGMMFKMDFDPRVIGNEILPDGTHKTGIGDFIRRTSIDEFPQFFNVLKGEMSLVGTRPPTLDEWEKYELHHRARLAIKPGITGMWQVSGRSEITDFEEVVKLDVKYINEWSIFLDISILLKTIKQVFQRKGAL